jgi:hypothetical protein
MNAASGRVFVNSATGISTFVGSTNFGKDMNGAVVDTLAKFNAAVAALRTPNGRDPSYAWPLPTRWAKLETDLAGNSSITGNYNNTVHGMKELGMEPLMVIAVGGSPAAAGSGQRCGCSCCTAQ